MASGGASGSECQSRGFISSEKSSSWTVAIYAPFYSVAIKSLKRKTEKREVSNQTLMNMQQPNTVVCN